MARLCASSPNWVYITWARLKMSTARFAAEKRCCPECNSSPSLSSDVPHSVYNVGLV